MGELQAWLPHQNGVLADFNPQLPPSPRPHPLNPRPSEINEENWRLAEKATRKVIETIQATIVSEKRRQEVIEYVQRLIRGCLGSEVFPFGSVPLKTYLPDGDIDLTALGLPDSEDILASNVRHILETEEKNKDAEFEVKDVQYIHAEVKLVKCLVQNIVVDISFNQTGGLSTLCFLELVDTMIGKGHLFKRSIILIKAWCYYESRILGAHIGLISTFALETLVLYIFHLYYSSLDGPLAVLYRFLDYYSKFDWVNFCISLYGPISVSSLPELVAEAPENDEVDLFFSKEFLKKCGENFWLMPKGWESNSRKFPQKYLNIVDPLRETNNLGRSVSKGNFYRIRSAFTYGSRKLGNILLLPSESITTEVNMFFANTLDRHGSGERPDVQGAFPSCTKSTSSDNDGGDSQILQQYATGASGELCEEINNMWVSGLENVSGNSVGSNGLVESRHSVSDAKRLAAGKLSSCSDIREKNQDIVSTTEKNLISGKAYHIPHLFFHSENGNKSGGPRLSNASALVRGQNMPSTKPLSSSEEVSVYICETVSPASNTPWLSAHEPVAMSLTSEQLENSEPVDFLSARGDGNGANGSSNPNKADLTGDYEMHFRNFLYVRWSQEYISGTIYPFVPQSPSYQYRNKHSWDPARRHGLFAHRNANGVVPGLPFPSSGSYPIHFASSAYGMEDSPKPRGIGTYFPNTNSRTYKEQYFPARGKNPVPANNFSSHCHNGGEEMPLNDDLQEKGGNGPAPQSPLPSCSGSGRAGKSTLVEVSSLTCPPLKEITPANSFVLPPDAKLEFGSFGPMHLGSPSSDTSKRLDSFSPHTQGSQLMLPSTARRPSTSSTHDRSTAQAYQLKDEGDFPPLTG